MSAPIHRLAKKVAYVADDLTPRDDGVVVLAYHRVGARTDSSVDLPTPMFERQLDSLAKAGAVIDLDSATEVLARESAPPRPGAPVVLTFDDGTADFVDVVLPRLVEHDLPATVYVATEHIDSQRHFPGDGVPASWSGLREAASTGLVHIGAHTHTHVLLDRLDVQAAADELQRCDDRISEEIGVRPRHFAYPKAVLGAPPAEHLVRHRYRSAAVAGTRPNVPGRCDPHRLHRSPIQRLDRWEGFVRKRWGGMTIEDDVRRQLNRIRYRGATR